MATAENDGSGFSFVSGGTWVNTANAFDGNATTFTSLTTNVAGPHVFDITGFNFGAQVGPTDTLDANFQINVFQYVSSATRWNNPTVQCFDGATLIGSLTLAESTSPTNAQTTQDWTAFPTLAQLRSPNFKIRFTANKNGSQSATQFFGACFGQVFYTVNTGQVLADVSSPITSTLTADIVKGRTVSNSTIATAVLTGAAALATLVSTNTPVTANLTASALVGSVASAFSTDVTASFNSDANHNQAVSTDTIITTAVTADALIANTVSVNSTNIVASFDSDANHNQAIGSDSAITITVTTDAVTGFKAVTSTPITSTLTANSVVTRYADVDVPVTATLTSNATVTSNNIILGEVEVVTTAALNADAQHYQNVQSSRDVTASLSANTRVTSLVQASNTPVIATFAADAQHYQGVQGTQEVTANLNASARVASSVSAVNTSAIVALTADAQHIQYVDPSTEITAGLTADAQHYQGIETSVGITAGLTGSASRTSNMLVSTSIVADIAADVRNQTNLEVSLGVTAGLTADASIGYTFQAVTELEADLFADVSQGFPVTSDTTNVTATVSGNILKGRVASTLTNVTTTLTADALKVTTGQTETSVTVGLPATVTKNILTGSSLGVTANFSTNSRRSNPLTDRDIDVTVALSHGIWIASLDDQPWVIVEGVSIIEATLDPAVETYASLDIDSNYYTLAPNLWEVTL